MQDLVRVGVADSREDPRITKGALHRVVAGDEPLSKTSQIAFEHLEAARIVFREGFAVGEHVERGAFLAAGFRDRQLAGGEEKHGVDAAIAP